MGVAGAGKSVQGRKLADELGLPWLSTGEFLRMLISGERRKEMQDGKLLEDKEIITLVRKIFAVVDVNQEFILDGFPRTVGQADWLLGQVKHGQLHITAVIHIKASEDVVTERLMRRGRQDDHADAIAARFKEYREAILPILVEFKKAGTNVCEVDGDRSEADVYKDILAQLTSVRV
jgi:adenylate kinase